jgi:hypothetical protein
MNHMKTLTELWDEYNDFFEDVEENWETAVYGYTEPGYSLDGEKELILFGDWNIKYKEKYGFTDDDWDRLEELVEFEWCDAWAVCSECRKAVRTQPNGWGWRPSFWVGNAEIICAACTLGSESRIEEYLEMLEDNPEHAMTLAIDLSKHGYVCVLEDMEHGFHHGQNQSPDVIAKSLRSMRITRFIFTLDSTSQWTQMFSVWVHTEELDRITGDIKTNLPYDIATEMARVLQGQHSDYIGVKSYIMSQEDFINGRMPR